MRTRRALARREAAPSPRFTDCQDALRGRFFININIFSYLDPQTRRLVAGARDVFRVAAAVLVDAVGRQLQHAVRQRGQEVPVVFDDRRCL